MKKISYLFGFSLLLFCLSSCNKDDDAERWVDTVSDGGPFATQYGLHLFYVDEQGNDLIDLANPTTYPVSSVSLTGTPPAVEEPLKKLPNSDKLDPYYNKFDLAENGFWNTLSYESSGKLNRFFTYAYGDSRQSNGTFYVYFKGKADKMDVTYRYQLNKVKTDSRKRYYAEILSWKINGATIYEKGKSGTLENIYLIKKQDGTTEISKTRPIKK